MFWWFKRGDEYLRYESRQIAVGVYQLCVITVDGTERVETFDDERDLLDRQRTLESNLTDEGFTGPHGWNL
jgi:hypothetical protein